jgi:hypothetical protein
MADVMAHLLARGVSGPPSGEDQRLLAWLGDQKVNRRVFGLPLPATLGYYREDFWPLLTVKNPPVSFTRPG